MVYDPEEGLDQEELYGKLVTDCELVASAIGEILNDTKKITRADLRGRPLIRNIPRLVKAREVIQGIANICRGA